MSDVRPSLFPLNAAIMVALSKGRFRCTENVGCTLIWPADAFCWLVFPPLLVLMAQYLLLSSRVLESMVSTFSFEAIWTPLVESFPLGITFFPLMKLDTLKSSNAAEWHAIHTSWLLWAGFSFGLIRLTTWLFWSNLNGSIPTSEYPSLSKSWPLATASPYTQAGRQDLCATDPLRMSADRARKMRSSISAFPGFRLSLTWSIIALWAAVWNFPLRILHILS